MKYKKESELSNNFGYASFCLNHSISSLLMPIITLATLKRFKASIIMLPNHETSLLFCLSPLKEVPYSKEKFDHVSHLYHEVYLYVCSHKEDRYFPFHAEDYNFVIFTWMCYGGNDRCFNCITSMMKWDREDRFMFRTLYYTDQNSVLKPVENDNNAILGRILFWQVIQSKWKWMKYAIASLHLNKNSLTMIPNII